VTLSGVTYSAACETSDVPVEEGWPKPKVRRVGKGMQYVYEGVTPDIADSMASHLADLIEGSGGFDDEEASRDRRAMARDLRRLKGSASEARP
jgi:hypothetical protein